MSPNKELFKNDPSSGSAVLQVKALQKSYGDRPILRSLSFILKPGERVGLMGPSGSGKSTLLNCLGGIDRPDEGEILLGGENLVTMDRERLARIRRARIAHIFQFFHLLPTLTAWENIEFPLQLNQVGAAERKERVDRLVEAVDLGPRARAVPNELSGGEMQRVAIARALAPNPQLILADEPTGNLDSKTGARTLDLLESLCEEFKTTLLLVTHDQQTTRICHRTLHLLDGAFTDEG